MNSIFEMKFRMSLHKCINKINGLMSSYDGRPSSVALDTEVSHGAYVLGSAKFGKIVIFPNNIKNYLRREGKVRPHGGDANIKRSNRVMLGEQLLNTLAHEMRHIAQENSWDDDVPLPCVAWEVQSLHPNLEEIKPGYFEDPGERDAREFAEKAVSAFSDDEKVEIAEILISVMEKKLAT